MSRSRGSVLLGRVLKRGTAACSCSYSHILPESSSAVYAAAFSTATAQPNAGVPFILNQFKLEAVRYSSFLYGAPLCTGNDGHTYNLPFPSSRHAADKSLQLDLCQFKREVLHGSSAKQRELLSARKKLLTRSPTSTFLRGHWELLKAHHTHL